MAVMIVLSILKKDVIFMFMSILFIEVAWRWFYWLINFGQGSVSIVIELI